MGAVPPYDAPTSPWTTDLLLMRHGEPDWDLVKGSAWRGAANDLAPLTAAGRAEALAVAHELRDCPPVRVVASPMTRALQTAAIVAGELGVPLEVELDLREWLPDETYQWTAPGEVQTAYAAMLAHPDGRPDGRPEGATWEPLDAVRRRATAVLARLAASGRTLVVAHEVLIHSVTGEQRTGHGRLRPWSGAAPTPSRRPDGFREAGPDDLDAVLRLYRQLHPHDPVLDATAAGVHRRILETPGLQLFVLQRDGEVVATTYLNVIPNLTRGAAPYAVVENVVVDERLRGTGLGKQVMAATLAVAWAAGCYKALLQTGSRRPSTHAFYRACGFRADDKTGYVARPPVSGRHP